MESGQVAARRIFQVCHYLLLGAASGCIFVTLSLRLIPSPRGLHLIFLNALTAIFAAAGCSGSFITPAAGDGAQHNAHAAGAVLTFIFQGAAAVFAFTRTADFIAELRFYLRDDNGTAILRHVGSLGAAIFVLKWVALALAFVLRLGDHGDEEEEDEYAKSWPSGCHV